MRPEQAWILQGGDDGGGSGDDGEVLLLVSLLTLGWA